MPYYINTLSRYFRENYGEKFYRLALSCSNTCPNRDGKCGTGGCAFCAGGSGSFAGDFCDDVNLQIEKAKEKVKNKFHGNRYIAYFQSYTSTYTDPEFLKSCLFDAAKRDDIAFLAVGTRPDCLGENIMRILKEASQIKPLWVELGVQTVNDKIAQSFNRGYKTEVFFDAVERLSQINIKTVAHVILGLPGESESDMLFTVKKVCEVVDGIKLANLHILKGTRYEKEYAEGKISEYTANDYADLLCKIIPIIPKNIVIHRLTGDGDKKLLMPFNEFADKKRIINLLTKKFEENNIIQGSALTE